MGMFSKLMGKIFDRDEEEENTAAAPAAEEATEAPAAFEVKDTEALASEMLASAQDTSTPFVTLQEDPVDVEALLDKRANARPDGIDWRNSIVDLMKIVDMDSSLSARKELAIEMGFPAEKATGSAEMNMWLHKEVMRQVVANGGSVSNSMIA